jgi:dTDP-4-dehydrorhamnose reductase
MMKVLITGSNGLLGQKLVYQFLEIHGVEVFASSKGACRIARKTGYTYIPLDITVRDEVQAVVGRVKPDCIINTAAMTNVDACENDKPGCKALNVDAVRFLTQACLPYNTHFIHLSTDFVFDGNNGPYSEEDVPNPLSYYAASKLESEQVVHDCSLDYAIIRTIIIYGVVDDVQRSNLVLWTKSSLESGKSIQVITDQYRSPTLAEDLAAACIVAAIKRAKGIYHVSGAENDLDSILNLVYKIADFFNLDKSLIIPVSSAQLNQPATRPPRTGFILDKARRDLDYKPHSFTEGLGVVCAQLELKKTLAEKSQDQ